MYRVAIEKATGKLIEMQSGGDSIPLPGKMPDEEKASTLESYRASNLQTLLDNAIRVGFKAEDVEVKFVTAQEWAAISAEATKPTPEQEREALIQAEGQRILRDMAIKSLQEKGTLAAEFQG